MKRACTPEDSDCPSNTSKGVSSINKVSSVESLINRNIDTTFELSEFHAGWASPQARKKPAQNVRNDR